MRILFYKPNPRNTGSAANFNYYNNTFSFGIVKQHSWSETAKTGSFTENRGAPLYDVTVKLSNIEVAGIINSLEKNVAFSGFHQSEKQTVQFSFKPYLKEENQIGFSLSVFKTIKETSEKASFVIGFTFPEAILVREFLQTVLRESFFINDKQKKDTTIENTQTEEKTTYPKRHLPKKGKEDIADPFAQSPVEIF